MQNWDAPVEELVKPGVWFQVNSQVISQLIQKEVDLISELEGYKSYGQSFVKSVQRLLSCLLLVRRRPDMSLITHQSKSQQHLNLGISDLNFLRQEMLKVLEFLPNLTPNGIKSDQAILGYDDFGKPEQLLEEQSLRQFSASKNWLSQVVKIESFNRDHTSYGYKHMVESWANLYISNGAFIAAAIALDFKIKRVHPKSLNVFLPISSKSIKEMEKQEE